MLGSITMNSNKKDSGWILCPSKSFPGKFYYFNVRNGEAVWGSSDIYNKTARKDTGHDIADKSHCYPEPSSPPLDEYPNIANVGPNKLMFTPQNPYNISIPNEMSNGSNANIGANTPTIQAPFQKTFINVRRTILNQQKLQYNTENLYHNFVQPSPQFNQAIFPKYVSNVDPYMQNVIWTPIQMPRPMIIANTPIKTEIFDQNVQTWEDRGNLTVQSCNIPLTKRFINFEENLQKSNEQTETLTSMQTFAPTDANIRNPSETNVEMFEPVNKSNFQPIRSRTLSESFEQTETLASMQMFAPTDANVRNPCETNIQMFEPVNKSNFRPIRSRTLSESNRSVISNDFVEKSKDTSFQIEALSPTHKIPFTRAKTLSDSNISVISNDFVQKSKDTEFQIKALSPAHKVLNPRLETQSKSNNFEEKSEHIGPQIKTLSPRNKALSSKPLFEKNEWLKAVNDQSTVIKYPHLKCLERNDSASKPTLSSPDKVENKSYEIKNLDKSDLRFLIMAKRRAIGLGGLSSDVEGKKIKTSGIHKERKMGDQKKRVTFLISDSSDTNSEELQQEHVENDSQDLNENAPINQLESVYSNKFWYIVPDTEAMLEEFQLIEKFVLSEGNCRLMLPHAVRAEIVDISAGDGRGQRRVIVAQMLLRRLATLPRHVLCQNPEESNVFNKSTMDRILLCCLELKDSSHVILITNDVQLLKKANLNNISAYTLQDIKDGTITTDILKREHEKNMKIHITLKNETNPNLFLQNVDEFDPFPLNKKAILVNMFRIPLFKDGKLTDKHTDMRDAVTSPINIDTLINEDKLVKTSSISFDIESDPNDIEVDMQNLVIIEKSQSNKIIFGLERDLKNKNNNLQSNDKNREVLSKQIEKSYESTLTKHKEYKYQDIPNQKTNDRKETTEQRFYDKNILINRTLRSKIDKSVTHNIRKTSNINLSEDTDVTKNERLQGKISLIDKVLRSEIGQLDTNVHRVVNTATKSDNISVQKDIRHNTDQLDPMNIDIIHANVDEKLKLLKNRLTEKVVRPKIAHQNVTNSLNDKLKKFQVKNELMADAIELKIEELLCTFTQIMEEVLSRLLHNSNSVPYSLSPPWTLHEALTCIKKVYDNSEVRMYADELTLLILNNCCKQGKLQCTVKPKDFMRIVGLGSLLIDFLKSVQPDCDDLTEAQQCLNIMCENISSTVDIDDIEPSTMPARNDDDEEPPCRKYFVKKPADVIEWLTNHFSQWKTNEAPDNTIDKTKQQQITLERNMKIVRTSGRNINLLTINNTKSMTLNQPIDKNKNYNTEVEESADPKPIMAVQQNNNRSINKTDINKAKEPEFLNKNAEPKIIRLFSASTPNTRKLTENELDIPTHGNTFNEDNNDGPKVIRNLNVIDAFEEKLNASNKKGFAKIDDSFSTLTFNISPFSINDDITNNESQDMSFDFINKNTFNEYSSNNDQHTQNNDTFKQNNDTFAQINDNSHYDEIINEFVQMNEENGNCMNDNIEKRNMEVQSTDDYDSGFENDSTQMYTVLRMFLAKLSASLKMIYKFIDESILEFRNDKIQGDKLKSLQDKATQTHEQLAGIIYKLKCIIQRESGENTVLKEMLITSGILTTGDKRMTRYRQVVTKCLEQAQMLENALKIMLTIADGDLDTPLYTHVQSPVYFNIFE